MHSTKRFDSFLRQPRLLLIAASLLLAWCVITLGAYTRLKDAGLGCPDWPGCYGSPTVPDKQIEIDQANALYPERPVEVEKARAEMVHRYFAGSLGGVIVIIFFATIVARRQKSNAAFTAANTPWFNRPITSQKPSLILPAFLTILVVFQALLGMWTVTLGLFPTVVTSHLIAGFSTFALLVLLFAQSYDLTHFSQKNIFTLSKPRAKSKRIFCVIGMILLTLQTALGGWTASNYAGLACTTLPICDGAWWQSLELTEAFQLFGHQSQAYEYAQHLSFDAKKTIHIFHRLGAIIVTLYISWLLLSLFRICNRGTLMGALLSKTILVCGFLLITQVSLGVANIVYQMPLGVALLHNANGALLFSTLLLVTFLFFRCTKSVQ
jgi:heme a synthase